MQNGLNNPSSTRYIIAVLFLLCSYLTSCAGKKKEDKAGSEPETVIPQQIGSGAEFETGKIISTTCADDPVITYSLYLPAQYRKEKKLPLIICFDPHADGALPLANYKNLAEKFNYILVGSDNSKNGIARGEAMRIANTILRDAVQKISVDENRIYTCGFSGGAEIACNVATGFKGFAGVIACSGGKIEPGQKFQKDFFYIAIAGLDDFNYYELEKNNESLNNASFTAIFLQGNHKHEWPQEKLMNKAFVFTELQAIKNKTIENNSLVEIAKKEFEKEISSAASASEKWRLNKQAVAFLSGLTKITAFSDAAGEFESSAQFKAYVSGLKKIKEFEGATRQAYIINFKSQDLNYWQNEIDKIKQLEKSEKNPEQLHLINRLKGFIGILAFSFSTQAVRENMFADAQKYLGIYKSIEPENSEAWFLSAQLYAHNNYMAEAQNFLTEACKKGFKEKQRIESDEKLKPFLQSEELKKYF